MAHLEKSRALAGVNNDDHLRRLGSSVSPSQLLPVLSQPGTWQRLCTAFVLVSVLVGLVCVAIATATWAVMFTASERGFSPLILTSERQKVRACLFASRNFEFVARSLVSMLSSSLRTLHLRRNLTHASALDALLPLINNSDIDAIYFSFPDGQLIGLEQDVLAPKNPLSPFRSLLSNGTGLVVTPVDSYGMPVQAPIYVFPDYNATKRPWFVGALLPGNQEGFWTQVYLSGVDQINSITRVLPWFDDNGTLVAVVGADVSLRSGYKRLSRVQVSPSGRGASWLYGSHGGFIAVGNRTLLDEVLVPYSLQTVATVSNSVVRDAMRFLIHYDPLSLPGPGDTIQWDRVPSLIAGVFESGSELWLVSVLQFSSTGSRPANVTIVVVSPKADYFSLLDDAFNLGLAVSLGVVTPVAVFLMASFTFFFITRPLTAVATGLQKVADGQLVEPLKHRRCHCSKYSLIWEMGGLERTYDKFTGAMASFSKYVPSSVVDLLLLTGKTAVLEVKAAESTIFFSDVSLPLARID